MSRRRFEPGDRPIPGYKLEKWLGQGAFGEVWKASGPGVDVAIKIVHDLRRNVGGKELRALRTLRAAGSHSNLISLHGYWCLDAEGNEIDLDEIDLTKTITETAAVVPKTLIVVMDLAECSLIDLLDKRPEGVPSEELLVYIRDAARGIDFLNIDHRIQHCDIKPANIFLKSGSAMVGDFGLAKMVDEIRESMSGETPGYSAPELSSRNGPSGQSDQYSLAISYVELRTGKLPYEAETFDAVLHAKATGQLYLENLPDAERSVIERATHVNPEIRFEKCADFVEAMEAAVKGIPVPVPLSKPSLADTTDLGEIKGTLTVDSLQRQPSGLRPTTPNSSADTKPDSDHRTKVRPGKRNSFWLIAASFIGIASIVVAIVFLVSRPSDQERILGLLAKGQFNDARVLLSKSYEKETDEFIRRGWRNYLIDQLNSEAASTTEIQTLRAGIEQYRQFYPEDGEKILGQLDGDIEAICGEAPAQIQRALAGMATNFEESFRIAENWLKRLEPYADRQEVAEYQWQLQLLKLWCQSRRDTVAWGELQSELRVIAQDGRDFGYSRDQEGLIEVLDLVVGSASLKEKTFDDHLEALEAYTSLVDATEPGNLSKLFLPNSLWSPTDLEKENLATSHGELVTLMKERLAGNYFPPELYEPYYESLGSHVETDPILLLGKARLNVALGKISEASRIYGGLDSPPSALQTESEVVELLATENLIDFEERLASTQVPTPIRLALVKTAISTALDRLVDLDSDKSKQDLAFATRLAKQMNADERQQVEERIAGIQAELLDKLRAGITQTAKHDSEPEWSQLLVDCELAGIDESTDTILQLIQIECQLETGTREIAPWPATVSQDEEPYRDYLSALQATLSNQQTSERLIEALPELAAKDSFLSKSFRKKKIGRILVASSMNLVDRDASRRFAPALQQTDASVMVQRFEKAKSLGWTFSAAEAATHALAAWRSGDSDKGAVLTRQLVLDGHDFVHRDFLIWAWGRHAASQGASVDVDLVAAPFADLLLSIPPQETPTDFQEQFEEPAQQLLTLLSPSNDSTRTSADRLALARLCVLVGDFERATRYLSGIDQPPEIASHARVELAILRTIASPRIGQLQQQLEQSSAPQRLLDSVRLRAIERALEKIDGSDREAFAKTLGNIRDFSLSLTRAEDRSSVEAAIDELTKSHVESWRAEILQRVSDEKPDFEMLLSLCRIAKVDKSEDGRLRLALAEAEWETDRQLTIELPQESVREVSGDFSWSRYQTYVNLMLSHESGDRTQLVRIQKLANDREQSLGSHRLERLGKSLVDYAVALSTAGERRSTAQIAEKEFGDQADQAESLFRDARRIRYNFEPQETAFFAAALWDQEKDVEAWELTEELLDESSVDGEVAGYLTYSAVRFFSNSGAELDHDLVSKTASAYAGLIGKLDQSKQSPAMLVGQLIQPGVALVQRLKPRNVDKETRKAIADMLALGGDLIHDHPDANWDMPTRRLFELQRDFYDLAIEFRPETAHFHYGRGIARFSLSDIEGAWSDVNHSLRLDSDVAQTHFLLGRIKSAKARRAPKNSRHEAFKSALASYDQAYKLRSQHDTGFEGMVLGGRGQAHLEYANYIYNLNKPTPDDEAKALIFDQLNRAKRDAAQVVGMLGDASPHSSVHFRRLGNILEDFGWLLGHEPDASYQAALKHFSIAIKAASNNEARRLAFHDRGRCSFKLARWLSESADEATNYAPYLESSIADLERAQQLEDTDPQTWLWLGRTRSLQGEIKLAVEAWKRAIELGGNQSPPWSDRYVPALLAAVHMAKNSQETGSWEGADTMFHQALQFTVNDALSANDVRSKWQETMDATRLSPDRVFALRQLFEQSEVGQAKIQLLREHLSRQITRIPQLQNEPRALELYSVAEAMTSSKAAKAVVSSEKAIFHLRKRDLPSAIASYSAAIQTDPENINIANWHFRKGILLLRSDPKAALTSFRETDRLMKRGKALDQNHQAKMSEIKRKYGI